MRKIVKGIKRDKRHKNLSLFPCSLNLEYLLLEPLHWLFGKTFFTQN